MLPALDIQQESQSELPTPESPLDGSGGGRNLFLIIVSWIVGCQYGLILWLGLIVNGWTMITGMDVEKDDASRWFYWWMWELALAAFGIWMMHLALKDTTDRKSVKACMILAAGLAPACSYLARELLRVLIYDPKREAPGLEVMLTWLITFPLHFYLPFIVFTIWVRLRYHRSEF